MLLGVLRNVAVCSLSCDCEPKVVYVREIAAEQENRSLIFGKDC